ncbi:hypothetical protein ABZS77_22555 [Micromonospora sp. NPDC005298]|uniref:hypothetical protein n=1 Tax=Micromonospora sp. NPDC005298 TaxID=3156873 RepID=UPI0033A9EDC5
MEFVLDPPHEVGPLRLGMTIDEARAARSNGTLILRHRRPCSSVAWRSPGKLG